MIKVSPAEIASLARIAADEPPSAPVIHGEFRGMRDVACPSCAGHGKVSCGILPGAPLLTCQYCGGRGKVRAPGWMIVRAIRRAH